jgi:uncharacterized protein (DUF58 family)
MPDIDTNLEDDFVSREDLRDQIDAEVKRVSNLFRFVLKYQRHFQPSGVEFSGLRQYLPSDDASRIDWKNSAGKPDLYVKQYEEDLQMDAFIMLDASSTMEFGTAEKVKSEYSAVVAASIAYASIDAGIDVGLGMWGDDDVFLTPSGGDRQYNRFLDELSKFENYGGTFDMESAMNDVIGQVKENTAIFLVSDFLDVEDGWKSKVTLANKKFRHFMTIMVRDLRDYKLPDSGNFRFESMDGEQTVVNTSRVREEFNQRAQEREESIEEKLSETGSSFMKVDTRDSFSAEFAEFFDQDQGEW